jgi:hypothetical protein
MLIYAKISVCWAQASNPQADAMILEAALGMALRLVSFDEVTDALSITLAMTTTGDGICAAGGFDYNLGPEDARRDMYRSDLGNSNTFFVAAEEATLDAGDTLGADYELCWKNEISMCPPGCGEGFGGRRIHGVKS